MVDSKPTSMDCKVSNTVYCLTGSASASSLFAKRERTAATQLREEGEFYVPDLLSDSEYRPSPATCSAAAAYGRHLKKAERHVDEARLLSDVLRASLADACDGRAMQVDTVLEVIDKKLRKARQRMDRHDARYLNLFLAYTELGNRQRGGDSG